MASRSALRFLFPLLLLAATIGVVWQVRALRSPSSLAARSRPSTVPKSKQQLPGTISAEARLVTLPGAQVSVSADFEGVVDHLSAREGDRVRAGRLLGEIRASDLDAALAEERARVAEAEVEMHFAEIDLARSERMADLEVGTREAADRGRNRHDLAKAKRETALASVARIEVERARARIVAPISGTILARTVEVGERVERGTQLFSIADLGRTRLEAEVDEFDIGRVLIGAEVVITVEGHENKQWRGVVEEIPSNVVARTLKALDPGRPSDVRVLLVKIRLSEPTPLKLGQRAEVTIKVAPTVSSKEPSQAETPP